MGRYRDSNAARLVDGSVWDMLSSTHVAGVVSAVGSTRTQPMLLIVCDPQLLS